MKTWEEIWKAPLSDITPEQVKALPRLSLEKNRYGTTFTALNAENRIVRRGVVHFHVGDVCKKHPGVRLVPDVYVDCPRCRKERFYRQQQWRAEGLDDDGVIRRLQEFRDDGDLYWCNDCQGTGWVLEPWADVVARHGAVTWEDKAMALTGPDLANMLRLPTFKMPYPEAVLRAEAARRLDALG